MTSQRRAVIAAQDARLCRSLREGLEALGFVTWNEVSDGLAALTQIRRTQPHLVVLAPPLTSLDGGQVMETLIRGEMAPVVLVLGEGDPPPEASIREASACAQLVRPFTAEALAAAVELAEQQFRRLFAIRAELQQLRAERSGSRLLERAKSLLMRRLMIHETEAFWRIQDFCLESEKPARAAVEALIAAQRLTRESDELTPR